MTPAPAPGVDWSSCNLSEADLSGANLTSADLSGAVLVNVNFSGANLTSVDLSGSDMYQANLDAAFVKCGTGGVISGIASLYSVSNLPTGWIVTYLGGDSYSLTVPNLPCPPVAAIPTWVQAYARADKDATCEDGWSQSWQAWAEPVSGGWVCTRTIPSLG